MQHVESSVKIYFTKDYSVFKMITGNRDLNLAKNKRIRNDITQGLDVLRYCPILVKEVGNKLEIIDGQHRFAVAKELKSKVWYIVVEEMTLHDIAKINSNTEKWKTTDYINCYKQQKNENYIKLEKFMADYSIPLAVSVFLLSKGKTRGEAGMDKTVAEGFKRGLFEVKFEKEAVRFAEACRLFEDFPGWNTRSFITAIEIILNGKKCDFAELVDKFKADPASLIKKGSTKEYLTALEEIYNYRMRTRRVIY